MIAGNDHFIGIDDMDATIYRIFSIDRFYQVLQSGNLVLVEPRFWEDPRENVLMHCGISDTSKRPFQQHFFDAFRRPIYAQCWSMVKESDALWRAYSIVKKDPQSGRNRFPELEGVQVKSTRRKLFDALRNSVPSEQADTCFLGKVEYKPERELMQYFANEIAHHGLEAFAGGLGHAKSVLLKRDPFSHEQEIRLLYVGSTSQQSSSGTFSIPVNPNDLFEQVVVDPRLLTFEKIEREDKIIKLGYLGPIERSELYQGIIFDIPLNLGIKG